MSSLLVTGFPGFLGFALLPRLLQRREGSTAVCLVQPAYLSTARARLAEIETTHPDTRGRIRLITGDITSPDLALDPAERTALDDVSEIWHLAAIYDLTVDAEVAERVNVGGTRNMVELAQSLPKLTRFQYVSTCYVSGTYAGEFPEDGLIEGQEFRNHYEATKYAAECVVREAMSEGLPGTIYRPGIVVGDSTTGETQKYDGPYFLATFLRRLPYVALVPRVADPDVVRFGLAPRDFVLDAMDELSVLDRSLGKTYALTDPDPPTVRELVETFANILGKRVMWIPLPLGITRAAVGSLPLVEPLLGLPAESLDYVASPTTYSTTNTTADLVGTGVSCPPFAAYASRLISFMLAHPEVDSAAMV